MEIRPRLQSVNIFLILDDFEPNNVRVNLNLDNFEIILGLKKEIIHCKEFKIVPQSLSCFSLGKTFITFRFQTENLNQARGSSKFELITHKNTIENLQSEIFLKPNTLYNLSCFNCKQLFYKQVLFERVLPLPDNPDSSDWFCHAHNDTKPNLNPKIKEAFFSHTFVHLNENLLNGLLKNGSNLICKRCLAWIGINLKEAHKIWFNTVSFNDIKVCPLEDIFITLKQILNTSLLSSSKIVLSCQSSQKQTDFIILWVLEKKLKVYFDLGEDNGTYVGDVAKVLFRFDKNQSVLVDQWLNDVNISTVDISKPMMVSILDHLYKMNRFIPKDFSVSNDFYVSYLMMYKENENK